MKTLTVRLVWPCLACLALCSIVDLLYFPATLNFPDEHRFIDSAIQLAATGEFRIGDMRAWEMPGTALFFAPFVWLFGAQGAVLPIRFAQAILLAIQCLLVGCTARRVFGNDRAALIASWITALYPFLLYFQGLLLSETLFDTLLLAGVAALYRWRDRGLKIDGALAVASLCFAAATLTKATLTILPPLLLAATVWLAGMSWRRTFTTLLVASCLYGAFMSPWWLRNAELFGRFVPLTTGGSQNLYLGNNSHNPDAGIDWTRDVDAGFVAKTLALPGEMERERAFSEKATQYIKAEPATFLRAAGKKFLRFWNVIPNAVEFRNGLYSFISAASFGPVLALAAICVAWRWRQWRDIAPLYLIVIYFTLLHVVIIASLRYRLPIEPLLIILAAEPLAAVAARFRTRAAS